MLEFLGVDKEDIKLENAELNFGREIRLNTEIKSQMYLAKVENPKDEE